MVSITGQERAPGDARRQTMADMPTVTQWKPRYQGTILDAGGSWNDPGALRTAGITPWEDLTGQQRQEKLRTVSGSDLDADGRTTFTERMKAGASWAGDIVASGLTAAGEGIGSGAASTLRGLWNGLGSARYVIIAGGALYAAFVLSNVVKVARGK